MASRMIHYTVAELIADKINFNNKNQFMVGSLAPDMACYEADSHQKGIHKKVHFIAEYEELGVKGSDWLTDIQAKYIYSTEKETRMETIMSGYEDMHKCNSHIAERYGICYDIQPLKKFTVEEADISYQKSLLDDLKLDFLPYGDNFDLKVHNWNAIINYIEKCVNICLKEIELVMGGKEPDSPIPYMTPIDLK